VIGQHNYGLDNVKGLHNLKKKLMSVATKLSERQLCGVDCRNDGGDGTTKTVSGIFQVNVLLN